VSYYFKPSQSFGYYRGNPLAYGQGSGQGVEMAGSNVFSAGSGTQDSTGATWTPTVLYLFVLVIIEMFVFAFIGRHI
jgi:hypothetical protein